MIPSLLGDNEEDKRVSRGVASTLCNSNFENHQTSPNPGTSISETRHSVPVLRVRAVVLKLCRDLTSHDIHITMEINKTQLNNVPLTKQGGERHICRPIRPKTGENQANKRIFPSRSGGYSWTMILAGEFNKSA